VTARGDDDVTNAELLRRLDRIEATLRRLTGIQAGGAPDASTADADAWISYMARQSEDAWQLRRALGELPPLPRPERTGT
jgi:hypothetical protein